MTNVLDFIFIIAFGVFLFAFDKLMLLGGTNSSLVWVFAGSLAEYPVETNGL